jgi:hypothetical protein
MRHSTMVRIKRAVPSTILNWALLKLPFLYRTLSYESNLVEDGGIEDLLGQLRRVLQLDGDIVECGSSRCGTSIIMADFLRSNGITKKVQGPEEGSRKPFCRGRHRNSAWCSGAGQTPMSSIDRL